MSLDEQIRLVNQIARQMARRTRYHEAADLAQDAHVALAAAIPPPDLRDARAWTARVAGNAMRDILRVRHIRRISLDS